MCVDNFFDKNDKILKSTVSWCVFFGKKHELKNFMQTRKSYSSISTKKIVI